MKYLVKLDLWKALGNYEEIYFYADNDEEAVKIALEKSDELIKSGRLPSAIAGKIDNCVLTLENLDTLYSVDVD